MPSQPVRALAAELARRVTSAAAAPEPFIAVVVGATGSGRSGVLAAARAAAERSGRSTRTVDDLDRWDDAALVALEAAAGVDPGADIVLASWIEPIAGRDALGRLAQRAGRRNLLVHLGPLGPDELANGVAALTDGPPDRTLTEWLSATTADQPWLVHATIDALAAARRLSRGRFSTQAPALDDEVLAPVLDRVRAELRAIPAANRKALAAVVADHDPATLAEIAVAVPDDWRALCAAGLVTVDAVAPLVVLAAAGLLDPAERAAGHQAVSRLMTRRGASPLLRAEHAWAGRAHSEDASQGYLDAGFEVLPTDPRTAAAWFDRAGSSASATTPLALAGKGAQAEALVLAGDLPAAVELADYVLSRSEQEPHAAAAVALASAARGRWADAGHWSARVKGHHRVADDWWFWQQQAALLISGRVAEVDHHLGGVDRFAAATPVVAQLRDAVLVTRASLLHERDALSAARRDNRSAIGAQALSRPPAVAAVAPVELLAATALALGEPEGARLAFAGASHVAVNARRRAMARWTVLRCGDLVPPEDAAVAGANGTPAELDDAADPVRLAVAAALARRSGDVAATGVVARKLPRLLSTLHVDLLNLDACTELLVVARRFASSSVAEELEEAVDGFLAGIGRSPGWSARWHWAQLEAAIAAGHTDRVAPPARALQAVAELLPGVAVLADAAAVWVEVLAGSPEPARLDAAVRGLQAGGYVWEAAQLAGQAAIRVDDANLAKSLLGQARSLRGGVPVAASGSGGGREEGGSLVTPAGLSEREVEVARLVLNGLTHKAIGATLYISPKTVEHHVAHIRQKLGATNRAEFLAALRVDLAALADPA